MLAAIEHGQLVRTWLMRNTIHLVPTDDLRWMTALLGLMIRPRFEMQRWPRLGLTPDVLDAAAAIAPRILTSRTLTRGQFAGELAERGVKVDMAGQASTHVLVYLSTIGLTCRAAVIAGHHRTEVYIGGIIRPTRLRNGRVTGRWQLARVRTGATVTVTAFEPLPRTVRSALDAEVADLGRSLEVPASLRLAT